MHASFETTLFEIKGCLYHINGPQKKSYFVKRVHLSMWSVNKSILELPFHLRVRLDWYSLEISISNKTFFFLWLLHHLDSEIYFDFLWVDFWPRLASQSRCNRGPRSGYSWGILSQTWIFGWKTRENVVVLDFLAVDNFDFTRKIVKKILV